MLDLRRITEIASALKSLNKQRIIYLHESLTKFEFH